MNLINVISEIKEQINKLEIQKENEVKIIKDKYDKEIRDLQIAFEINIKMNTVCLECEGKKIIKVYSGGYEDRGENQNCDRCNGTGIEPN